MLKLNCAMMYTPMGHPPLLCRDVERTLKTKVLTGLGKIKVTSTPYSHKFEALSWAFRSVPELRIVNDLASTFSELVVFDESLNETIFTLAYNVYILARFVVDEAIVNAIISTAQARKQLTNALDRVQDDIQIADAMIRERIGDEEFQVRLAKRRRDGESYAEELDRIIQVHTSDLKRLFNSGWSA